ncbi:MAG: hypothetical protein H6Q89_1171 [Myxococcaceae bacterium]|nr:hypothetical protein [Myxococcaceae bacterium]
MSLVFAQALGDGRLGPLLVTEQERVINRASAIVADAPAGSSSVRVGDASPFAATDAVLVLQTQWSSGPRDAVGTWEIHRVVRVVGTTVELDSPLAHPFAMFDAQLVTLPEYTNVSVSAGAGLRAPAWNGSSGGVLALLVTGRVVNEGTFTASGAGLRGGGVREVGQQAGCPGLDVPAPLGSERGEGLARVNPLGTGRRNNDSGGGGGNCRYAGGGGGAHVGAGGEGGRSTDSERVGGSGGEPFRTAGLVLGGGGGAANGSFGQGASGGAGGGVVFLRALQVEGSGAWLADGADSLDGKGTFGPGAGGGAGGTVWLEVEDVVTQCVLSARGGNGGSSPGASAGGGGGGGRVLLRAGRVLGCPANVSAGAAGTVASLPVGAGPEGPLAPEHVGVAEVDERGRDAGYDPATVPRGPRVELLRSHSGCQCSQFPGLWLAPLGLLWLARRRR